MQVVPKGVRLVSCNTLQLVYEFLAPRTVTVAVGSNDQIVLALTGGEVIYLEADPRGTLTQKSSVSLDQDIACLSLYESSTSEDHDMAVDSFDQGRSTILAVGMWTDNSVRLFALQTLQELTRTQLGAETQAQARDVILVALGESSAVTVYLIIGLGDGTLITFIVGLLDGLPKLTNRRKVVLGTHPISLTSFNHAGSPCVFASCDRPTVLSTLNGKLIFSAVNIPEQTGMSTFHSELFPDCLALSSEIGLMIGMVDEIQRLHVQTHPMGESPRRIAHCRQSGAYAGETSDFALLCHRIIIHDDLCWKI